MKTAQDLRIPFSWDERHPVLLEKCLYIPTHYAKHEDWVPLPWTDPTIFGKEGRVAVEFCSGNGQWIAERAARDPATLWVAVEKRFDRARKIWARLQREKLDNLFVVCGDARAFTRFYAPRKSVQEIFINFPDPWPKLRHAKHRLIQKNFLDELLGIIQPEGIATFVTDDEKYRDSIIRETLSCPSWKPLYPDPFFTTQYPDYGGSWFSSLWEKKGRQIYYQRYCYV